MNSHAPESLRLFFALCPDEPVRSALKQLQDTVNGRLTPGDNLHLTLSFLGQQPPALLPVLKDILMHLPPIPPPLTLDHIGYFSRHRIAWAGMRQIPDALIVLHRELQQTLQHHDISFDEQSRFRPHVTLAREATPPPAASFAPVIWRANRIALMQSTTHAAGPIYHVLASRSLETE